MQLAPWDTANLSYLKKEKRNANSTLRFLVINYPQIVSFMQQIIFSDPCHLE